MGTLLTVRSLSESSRETTLPSQVDLVGYAADARSAGTCMLIALQSL